MARRWRKAKVISLHGTALPQQNRTNYTGVLRDLLRRAGRGEVRAFAVAWLDYGVGVYTHFECSTGHVPLLGAVTLLQHDILHRGDIADENAGEAG